MNTKDKNSIRARLRRQRDGQDWSSGTQSVRYEAPGVVGTSDGYFAAHVDGDDVLLLDDAGEIIYKMAATDYRRLVSKNEARFKDEHQPDGRRSNRGATGRRWARDTERVSSRIPPGWAKELVRLGNVQADAVRTAIDIGLHPFGPESLIVELETALPCGIKANAGECGKPAFKAHAYPWRHPNYPGHWVLVPVCRECAAAAAKVYEE